MIAYNIHTAQPVQRQKSPLEENVWLMPANCTDIEPPEFDLSTQTCSFNGTEWVVADIPIPEPEPTPEPIPAIDQLRVQRNSLLQETDWRFRIDQEPSQAWYEYCQALRDLPETAQPELDENGNLTNVEWPTKPSESV